MHFNAREDIELPVATVYAALTDFAEFERAALRRGAEVLRTGAPGVEGLGQAWTLGFRYRGKPRQLAVEITRLAPPFGLTSFSRSGSFEAELVLDLVALSPRRTRLSVALQVKPKSLGARLLLQSLRLAKSSLNNRLRGRVRQFVRDLEARQR